MRQNKQLDIQRNITIKTIKVILVGAVSVGKTSIAIRFTKNEFQDQYKETVGASFMAKPMDLEDNRLIFQIWDTAGQERYMSLVPMYMRDTDVAIVVYDVTDVESFSMLGMWVEQLHRSSPEEVMVIIVGNKIDKLTERTVSKSVAMNYAFEHGFMYLETSAKTGTNVDKLFHEIGISIGKNVHTLRKRTNESSDGPIKLGPREASHSRKCCR